MSKGRLRLLRGGLLILAIGVPAFILYAGGSVDPSWRDLLEQGKTIAASTGHPQVRNVTVGNTVRTVLVYPYSFKVDGQTVMGEWPENDPYFQAAFQSESIHPGGPARSGTVLVTYLPGNPSVHQVGRVEAARVRREELSAWIARGAAVLLGLVFGLSFLAACRARPTA